MKEKLKTLKMTLTQRIHCVPHTHDITNQHDEISPKEPRQDTDMETNEYSRVSVPVTDWKRHAHQWQLTGARSKITRKVKAVRCSDILHRRPGPHGTSNRMLPLREWTRTSAWEAYDTPRNEQAYTLHTGGFTLPCIPFPSFSSP